MSRADSLTVSIMLAMDPWKFPQISSRGGSLVDIMAALTSSALSSDLAIFMNVGFTFDLISPGLKTAATGFFPKTWLFAVDREKVARFAAASRNFLRDSADVMSTISAMTTPT